MIEIENQYSLSHYLEMQPSQENSTMACRLEADGISKTGVRSGSPSSQPLHETDDGVGTPFGCGITADISGKRDIGGAEKRLGELFGPQPVGT